MKTTFQAVKLTGREREESRGKGWEQGAKVPTRKSDQKIEEENRSREKGNGTEMRSGT